VNTHSGLLLAALVSLSPAAADAQQPAYPYPYPYSQPAYGPPPAYPPSYAPGPPAPPPAYVLAQRKDPFAGRFLRFYAGTSGFGNFVLHQSGGVEAVRSGGGISVFGGFDFGRVVGLQLTYSDSWHNPDSSCDGYPGTCSPGYLNLETLSADLRLHIPLGSFRPYVQAGIGPAWTGRPGLPSDAVGLAWNAGGGFDYFFGRFFSLGATVLYHGINLGDYGAVTGAPTELSTLTVDGNLALHF